MEREIERLLYRAGVLRTYVGYNYFIKAVLLVYENPSRLLSIGKSVYIPIAEEYTTDARSVEKDIRTVRDAFMRNNGHKVLKEIGCEIWHERPYPRELIEIFASYLRNLKTPSTIQTTELEKTNAFFEKNFQKFKKACLVMRQALII